MDKGHVLIVDDEETILSSLEAILKDEGYRVAVAATGETALEMVRIHSPDVVLLDVWMPGIDGIKTLQAVKESHEDVEVVIMSGHASIDTAVSATKLGAFDFIEKPLSIEVVLDVVEQAVQARRLQLLKKGKAELYPDENVKVAVPGAARAAAPPQKKRKTKRRAPSPPPEKGVRKGTPEKTIGRSVVLYGLGLHSGVKTGLILEPLSPGQGIRFGSLTSQETVAARVEYVENTNHATNLRNGTTVARTIEHLMSALHAYGITNLMVKMGEEIPNTDGSAADFCQLIEDAEIIEQSGEVPPLVVDKTIEVRDKESEDSFIRIEPAEAFSITYHLDYPEPIGKQEFTYHHSGPESFREELASARTFSFIWELESLEKMGLGEGGRWSNVILVDRERIVNTELRFPDEFVRHKILDFVGDVYLLGRSLKGKVTASKSGHRLNVELVRALWEAYS